MHWALSVYILVTPNVYTFILLTFGLIFKVESCFLVFLTLDTASPEIHAEQNIR